MPRRKRKRIASIDEIATLSFEELVRIEAQVEMPDSIRKLRLLRDGKKTPSAVARQCANDLIEHGHERPNPKLAQLGTGGGNITVILANFKEDGQIDTKKVDARIIDVTPVEAPVEGREIKVAVAPPAKPEESSTEPPEGADPLLAVILVPPA